MTTPSFLGSYCVHPPSYRTTFFESGPYFPPAPLSKYVLKCEIARDGADFEGCRTPGHSNPVFVLAPAPPQLCLKPKLPSRRISPTEECYMWLRYGWGMVSCIRAGAFHQSRLIIQDWSTPAARGRRQLSRGTRSPRSWRWEKELWVHSVGGIKSGLWVAYMVGWLCFANAGGLVLLIGLTRSSFS